MRGSARVGNKEAEDSCRTHLQAAPPQGCFEAGWTPPPKPHNGSIPMGSCPTRVTLRFVVLWNGNPWEVPLCYNSITLSVERGNHVSTYSPRSGSYFKVAPKGNKNLLEGAGATAQWWSGPLACTRLFSINSIEI